MAGSSSVALHRRTELESRLVGWGGNGILQYPSPGVGWEWKFYSILALPCPPGHAHRTGSKKKLNPTIEQKAALFFQMFNKKSFGIF
uniref:Uncharacterized protein n=1 Tax=Laticauda laticaudata TaxID=8630 RepID=A0A8C5RSM6_LATLA